MFVANTRRCFAIFLYFIVSERRLVVALHCNINQNLSCHVVLAQFHYHFLSNYDENIVDPKKQRCCMTGKNWHPFIKRFCPYGLTCVNLLHLLKLVRLFQYCHKTRRFHQPLTFQVWRTFFFFGSKILVL